jgi:cell pole-organizing protein PopZ
MSQAAKAPEPSMEEILASIRRIIADDDSAKPAAKAEPPPPPKAAPAPPPKAAAPPPPPPAAPADDAAGMNQDDIDAMLAGLEEAPEPEPAPPVEEPEEVLELTEAMEAAPEEPASFRKIDGGQDVVFDEAPAPAPPPRMAAPPPPPRPMPAPPPAMSAAAMGPDHPLISHATAAAVDAAFNSLAQTVLVNNAMTLEDLVKDMLRPMLQSWLDNNLPGVVERLVRAEIERVARGRG